eukprot:10436452-Heterocapsa_arctica.AAC.1
MPWCIICALAASRAADHHKLDGHEMGPPKMQFDYTYMKSDGGYYDAEEGRPTQPWATTLTGVGEATWTPLALSIPTKSPEEAYAV